MLNHLPPKGVSRIVTDRILNYDKITCDRILNSILYEKKMEDVKKQNQQRKRQELRQKLSDRHNKSLQLEIRSGVRLGMQGPSNLTNE